jgi:hypothetical protein
MVPALEDEEKSIALKTITFHIYYQVLGYEWVRMIFISPSMAQQSMALRSCMPYNTLYPPPYFLSQCLYVPSSS